MVGGAEPLEVVGGVGAAWFDVVAFVAGSCAALRVVVEVFAAAAGAGAGVGAEGVPVGGEFGSAVAAVPCGSFVCWAWVAVRAAWCCAR